MKDTAKNQLKKTLTDLKKDELTKIDKKGGIKKVEDEAPNGEDQEGDGPPERQARRPESEGRKAVLIFQNFNTPSSTSPKKKFYSDAFP